MNRIAICIGLACSMALAFGQAATKRIAPGKQLGKMSVGDLMEDMKWLKHADYGDASSGHQWQTWEARKPDPRNGKIINSLDVYSSVNDAGKYQIRLIRSTSPTFATADKIRVGADYEEIKKHYPKIAKIADYESPQFSMKVALYDDEAAGIAFEFKYRPGGVVFRHDHCLSIWVHEPGLKLLKEYYGPVEYLTAKPILRRAAKQAR